VWPSLLSPCREKRAGREEKKRRFTRILVPLPRGLQEGRSKKRRGGEKRRQRRHPLLHAHGRERNGGIGKREKRGNGFVVPAIDCMEKEKGGKEKRKGKVENEISRTDASKSEL